MADLYGALLAAAEEAKKSQKELEQTRADLDDAHIRATELEIKNHKLEEKFKRAGELMAQLANIFLDDQN